IRSLFGLNKKARKGRIVSLGKITDIVLTLKSLRSLYTNHPTFVHQVPSVFETSTPFGFRSFFDNKLLKINRTLAREWVKTDYFQFHIALPFSFLTRTHVHHILYETRPDRFFLLPNSFE